jgi:ribosomal protein S18 acetylase RimI-like enzyme
MEIRAASPADRPAIRDVARRSIQASYSLSPQAITSAIEEWYDEQRLGETLDLSDRLLLVAEVDGQVVGFSESTLSESGLDTPDEGGIETSHDATLLWLHVDPAYRGEGIGTALFDATRERLREKGVGVLRGRVLADNADGTGFYESRGFESVGQEEFTIGGRKHVEKIYVEEPSGMQPIATEDGRTVYIDRDEAETGSVASFYVVFSDPDREERYGYYCSNCEELANAMDAMGRIECDSCGNIRKPTRWDAAYM